MIQGKKIIITLLIGILSFMLTACDYEYYLYHEAIRKETQVVSVELINYDNLDAQEKPLETHPLDLDRLEVLEILNTDNIDSFLVDIEKIGGLSSKLKQVLKSPDGVGIRLTYQDDGFTLITITNINGLDVIFSGHYDKDAKVEGIFGISWQEMIDDFRNLLDRYFNIQ